MPKDVCRKVRDVVWRRQQHKCYINFLWQLHFWLGRGSKSKLLVCITADFKVSLFDAGCQFGKMSFVRNAGRLSLTLFIPGKSTLSMPCVDGCGPEEEAVRIRMQFPKCTATQSCTATSEMPSKKGSRRNNRIHLHQPQCHFKSYGSLYPAHFGGIVENSRDHDT